VALRVAVILPQDIVTAHEHFNMDEFVGQFQTALKVTAPRKRAFLLSWMQVLASVPDLDMLAYLPLFLSSLLDCLCDPFTEVRAQATKVLQARPPQPWSNPHYLVGGPLMAG
jgi:vacuole morphology and inheritance protein 14